MAERREDPMRRRDRSRRSLVGATIALGLAGAAAAGGVAYAVGSGHSTDSTRPAATQTSATGSSTGSSAGGASSTPTPARHPKRRRDFHR